MRSKKSKIGGVAVSKPEFFILKITLTGVGALQLYNMVSNWICLVVNETASFLF